MCLCCVYVCVVGVCSVCVCVSVCVMVCVCYGMCVLWYVCVCVVCVCVYIVCVVCVMVCVWKHLHHAYTSFSLDLIHIPNPPHWFISCLGDISVVKVSNYKQFIQ